MPADSHIHQSFLRNVSLLLLINVLVKPIYIFFIDAQVQNSLGENTYGMYFEIFNLCMLFQILMDPGILNYNTQLIAKNNDSASTHFEKIASSKLLLTGIYILLMLLLGYLMNYPPVYYQYLPGVIMILVLASVSQYLRSHFASMGKYNYEAWFSSLDKVLMILIIGYFLYFKKQIDLGIFIHSQLVALLLSIVFFIVLLKGIMVLRLRFSFSYLKALIKKTMPYALVLLLMTLYTRIDGVMLGRLLDDNAYSAGLYARSYRLLDAANMIGILFASMMLPMFARHFKEKALLNSLVEEISRLLFVICLIVVLVCWFYSRPIMDLVYSGNTEEHYKVFQYLLLGFFAMGMSNIFGCLFLAAEKLKKINLLFVLGILMNVSINYLLIPEKGAFGAVIATLITQTFVFVGQVLLAFREFKLRFTAKSYVGFLMLVGAAYVAFRIFDQQLHWNWLIEAVLISFLMLVLSFLLGFLRLSLIFGKKREATI